MSSVDERIVEMKFNNGQFQTGIDQTTQSLAKLEAALNIENSAKSLDTLASRVSATGVLAGAGLMKLADIAVDAGAKIYEATVGQIITGGEKRSQNFAQAEFQLKGLGVTGENLTKVMDAASYAVLGTAYGLDEAAVAASSFVASNVDIEKLPAALRGISGVAAMTNRSYGDIAQIFTTVAGNGRLMASELNRIGASGLNAAAALGRYLNVSEAEVRKMTSEGKINFEIFAAAMDEAFGEQATKANDLYTGSLANMRAALARIGEPLADGKFEKMRQIFNALTPIINSVKTAIMPLLNVIKTLRIDAGASIASILENFNTLSGNGGLFGRLRNLFMSIGDGLLLLRTLGRKFGEVFAEVWAKAFPSKGSGPIPKFISMLTRLSNGFNNFIRGVHKSEGVFSVFRAILTAILNPLSILMSILSGLGKIAWAIIQVIFQLGAAVWDLVAPLLGFDKAAGGTASTLQDFFATIKGGIDKYVPVIVGWINKFRDAIIGLRDGGSSGIEWIDKVYQGILKFRDLMGEKIPEFFANLKDGIFDFFKGIDIAKSWDESMKSMGEMNFDIFGKINWLGGGKNSFWTSFKDAIPVIWGWVKETFESLAEAFKPIGDSIKKAFENVGLLEILALLNSGALIAGIVGITKALKEFSSLNKAAVDMMGAIGTAFKDVGGAIKQFYNTMTADIKANILIKIAVAIALVAGSVWLLAQIPADRLWNSVGAIAALVVILGLMAVVLNNQLDMKAMVKLEYLSGAMVGIAFALSLLSASIWLLAQLDPAKMWSSLGAIASLLVVLGAGLWALSKYAGSAQFSSAAWSITVLALGVGVLAGSIWLLAQIPTDQLWKGFGALMAILVGVGTVAIAMGRYGGSILQGAFAIGVLALSLLALVGTLWILSKIPMDVILEGIGKMVLILGPLVLISQLMRGATSGLIQAAFAIGILAGSLILIAAAFWIIQSVPTEGLLGKVAIMVGVVAGLAAISQYLGKGTGIAGAFAIAIMSTAFVMLAAALWLIKDIPMEFIAGAMIALSIGFLAIAAAAQVLQGAIVGAAMLIGIILAIGLAFLMIGVAIALAALSIGLIAIALPLLGEALSKFGEKANEAAQHTGAMFIMVGFLAALGIAATIGGIGLAVLGLGLIVLAAGLGLIALIAPIATLAIIAMVEGLSELVQYMGPMLGVSVMLGILALGVVALGIAMLVLGVGLLLAGVGVFLFATGLASLIGLLKAGGVGELLTEIANSIPLFAEKVAEGFVRMLEVMKDAGAQIQEVLVTILLSVMDALREVSPQLKDTAVQLLLDMIDGLEEVVPPFVEFSKNLFMQLIEGAKEIIPNLIDLGTEIILAFLDSMEVLIPRFVDTGMKILVGLLDGIGNNIGDVVTAGADIIINFLNGIGENSRRIVDAGLQMVVDVLSGIAEGISARSAEINTAGLAIILAIAQGFTDGVGQAMDIIGGGILELGGKIKSGFMDLFGMDDGSMSSAGSGLVESLMAGLGGADDGTGAAAMSGLQTKLTELANVIPGLVKQIEDAFTSLATTLQTQSSSISTNVSAMMTGLAISLLAGLPLVLISVTMIIQGIVNGFQQGVVAMAPVGIMVGLTLAVGLLSSVGLFMPIGALLMGMFVAGLMSMIATASVVGIMVIALLMIALNTGVGEARTKATEIMNAFIGGVNSSLGRVTSAGRNVAAAFGNGVRAGVAGLAGQMNIVGYQIGAQIAAGMAAGMNNNIGSVQAAASALASSVPDTVKQLLAIRSPSRVATRLFEYVGDGAANGLYNRVTSVTTAAKTLGQSAIDGLSSSFATMSSISNEIDFDPTIRPVLDLTDVRAKAAELNSLMDTPLDVSESYAKAASLMSAERTREEEKSAESEEPTTSITYIQTNNSPKALSSAEVYRKTKNQLSRKGKVDVKSRRGN